MYSSADEERFIEEKFSERLQKEDYRSSFRKDYARLLHSPSFRRLKGKTQLFPGQESDFFRNRLTHSLEVAQIAKSIAIRINNEFIPDSDNHINPEIVEFAGLAHDLGHPPFGHQGEAALDECMQNNGGFEGNAQTLRILTKLEKKIFNPDNPNWIINGDDKRIGLNLTLRSLASIVKYDKQIPYSIEERKAYADKFQGGKLLPVKGFYSSEKEIINSIKSKLLKNETIKLKTVECQIMDIADDIAYSTYDLEDGLKSGFYNIFDILFTDDNVIRNIKTGVSNKLDQEINDVQIRDVLFDIFGSSLTPPAFEGIEINNDNFFDYFLITLGGSYQGCKNISDNGYLRTSLTSSLIGQFIRGIQFNLNKDNPILSTVNLEDDIKLKVETLKRFNYESQILSPRLKIVEFRGKEIVSSIFTTINNKEKNGFELLPFDYRSVYEAVSEDDKPRIICDYISNMTDNYCIEFYGRLKSEEPETIFKPLN